MTWHCHCDAESIWHFAFNPLKIFHTSAPILALAHACRRPPLQQPTPTTLPLPLEHLARLQHRTSNSRSSPHSSRRPWPRRPSAGRWWLCPRPSLLHAPRETAVLRVQRFLAFGAAAVAPHALASFHARASFRCAPLMARDALTRTMSSGHARAPSPTAFLEQAVHY